MLNPEWEERELEEMMKARQSRQGTFASEWRQRNSSKVWAHAIWQCPLCMRAVQTMGTVPHDTAITMHQIEHGADWPAYVQAGAPEPTS
jgi:hypothetical protein